MNTEGTNNLNADDDGDRPSPPPTLATEVIKSLIVVRCEELWNEQPECGDIWSELMLVCADKKLRSKNEQMLFKLCFRELAGGDGKKIAARLGHVLQAHVQLDRIGGHGRVSVNRQRERQWAGLYRALAQRGIAVMQWRYGACLLFGHGVEKDEEAAREWFKKAIGQGYCGQRKRLASTSGKPRRILFFSRIRTRQEHSMPEARRTFLEGVDHRLGRDVEQDDVKAFECFLEAAKQGYVQAMMAVAKRYYNGKGVKQDYGEAFHWAALVADHNDAEGQCVLAQLYAQGHGTKQDRNLALLLFCKAADQGYEEAVAHIQKTYASNVTI